MCAPVTICNKGKQG